MTDDAGDWTMQDECEHEWVYSMNVLCSDPPQRPAICWKCLEERTFWEGKLGPVDEYTRLVAFKREREAK